MLPSGAQRVAADLVADGANVDGIRDVASLGTFGKHSQNLQRDWQRWMNKGRLDTRMVPYTIQLTLKLRPDEPATSVRPIGAMLAYEYVHMAYTHNVMHKSFISTVGSNLEEPFWRNSMKQEWGRLHPIAAAPEEWATAFPTLWHYDGVVSHTASGDKTELNIVSVSSLTIKGACIDTRFPILACDAALMVPETFDEIALFIAWQQTILMKGRGAKLGMYLEEFAPGTQRARLAGERFAGPWSGWFAGVCVYSFTHILERQCRSM